jgi:hypothetical protein
MKCGVRKLTLPLAPPVLLQLPQDGFHVGAHVLSGASQLLNQVCTGGCTA